MKLKELIEEQETEETESTKGTYAGARFSKQTVDDIKSYCEENEIPNPLKSEKLHTTILYSRKYLPEYNPCGMYDPLMVGKPKGFDVWKTTCSQGSTPDPDAEQTNCLVLEFDCPELEKRHEGLMKEHEATYDYDEYKTHVTLSYDIGDVDIKDLPPYTGVIEIEEEYGEDLDLDWASEHK